MRCHRQVEDAGTRAESRRSPSPKRQPERGDRFLGLRRRVGVVAVSVRGCSRNKPSVKSACSKRRRRNQSAACAGCRCGSRQRPRRGVVFHLILRPTRSSTAAFRACCSASRPGAHVLDRLIEQGAIRPSDRGGRSAKAPGVSAVVASRSSVRCAALAVAPPSPPQARSRPAMASTTPRTRSYFPITEARCAASGWRWPRLRPRPARRRRGTLMFSKPVSVTSAGLRA